MGSRGRPRHGRQGGQETGRGTAGAHREGGGAHREGGGAHREGGGAYREGGGAYGDGGDAHGDTGAPGVTPAGGAGTRATPRRPATGGRAERRRQAKRIKRRR